MEGKSKLTEFREIKPRNPKCEGKAKSMSQPRIDAALLGSHPRRNLKGGTGSGTTRGILASTGVLFIQSPPVGREGGGDIVMGNGRVARGGEGGEGGAGRLGEEG